jgi:micrococcal nuclease
MILNRNVRLEGDVTDRDSYDRILRYVYCSGKSVNAEMVRAGCAEMRFYPPDTLHKTEYLELEKIAVRNKQGLWAFPVFQVPDTSGVHVKTAPSPAADQEIISWQDAHNYYGKTKTVEGKIVVSNNTGKVCFLNFDKNWKKYFTAVIFSSDYDKFPDNPEDYYLNRMVRVTGLIKEYQGKPEIIIKNPDQIQIIE